MKKEEFFNMIDKNFGLVLGKHAVEVLKEYNLTLQQLRRLYYKSEEVTEKNMDKFADIMGDLLFVEGLHRFVKIQFEQSSAPTYMYQFSYDSQQSIARTLITDVPAGKVSLSIGFENSGLII